MLKEPKLEPVDDNNVETANFMKHCLVYKSELFAQAMRMIHHHDDAEDLLAEVFAKAFRFNHDFQRGTNLRAWLFRILFTTFINGYKKRKKDPQIVEPQALEELDNRMTGSLELVGEISAFETARMSVRTKLEKFISRGDVVEVDKCNLTEADLKRLDNSFLEILGKFCSQEIVVAYKRIQRDFRLVWGLSDILDYSYKEIAQILNIQIATVTSRLYRARQIFRKNKDVATLMAEVYGDATKMAMA